MLPNVSEASTKGAQSYLFKKDYLHKLIFQTYDIIKEVDI